MVSSDQELEDALRYPLERWRLFLHPRQQVAVEKPMAAKLLLNGGAGTGKTVVIVHRAVGLRRSTSEIMILTKSRRLADSLLTMVDHMSGGTVMVGHLATRHSRADAVLFGDRLIWQVRNRHTSPISVSIALPEDQGQQRYGATRLQHVLVDEAHDLEGRELDWLIGLLSNRSVGLTIGFDQSQATNLEAALSLIDRVRPLIRRGAVEEVYLDYCYRMTREIFDEAYESRKEAILDSNQLLSKIPLMSRLGPGVSVEQKRLPVFYGLSGRPVKSVDVYYDMNDGHEAAANRISAAVDAALDELLVDYPADDIAVVHCSGRPFETSALTTDISGGLRLQDRGVKVLASELSRGLEWFAGIVVIDMGVADEKERYGGHRSILSIAYGCTLHYVALSRFRDRLIVIRAKRMESKLSG